MRVPVAVPPMIVFGILSGLVVSPATGPGEVRAQTEEGGLAIYGTVRVAGSREPVPGAHVTLLSGLVFRPDEVATVDADANGQFAFTNLSKGVYTFQTVHPSNPEGFREIRRSFELAAGEFPSTLKLWLEPMATIFGRVMDTDGDPVTGACVSVVQERRVMGVPMFEGGTGCENVEGSDYEMSRPAGEYLLRATPGRNAIGPFVTQFYPGVLRSAQAAPILLRAGARIPVDIRLADAESFRIRFQLALPERLPGEEELLSASIERGEPVLQALLGPVGGDGIALPPQLPLQYLGDDTWQTPPVPKGEYDLLLRYPALNGCMGTGGPGANPCYPALDPIGIYRVVVVDRDADLEILSPAPRVSMPGRIVFRSRDGSPSGELRIIPALRFTGVFALSNRSAEVTDDETFLVDSLVPGTPFLLAIDPEDLPAGSYVASATSGNQDVLRNGLYVDAGPTSPIEIVVSDDGGEIAGVVRGRDDSPLPEALVLLIPSSQRRGPASRFPVVAANQFGAYELTRIPPGQYRLLAVDPAGLTLDFPDYEDADFLRDYEFRGQLITVDPGARMTINAEAIPIYE